MAAVIARTLGSPLCVAEAAKLLAAEGMDAREMETALATLQSARLRPEEAGLLAWARDTVYYETGKIQTRTREIGAALGEAALLDAIGVASLANATVRLAMLAE